MCMLESVTSCCSGIVSRVFSVPDIVWGGESVMAEQYKYLEKGYVNYEHLTFLEHIFEGL